MKNTIFKGLNLLVLMGVALSVMSLGVAKAQVSSLKITDANGKEVIFYQESHALVIWAGDYQYWDKLNNIENEANNVVDALKRQGFQVKLAANPKGQKLRDEIQAFINNYGYAPNNRLVIFFAGHGHTRKKTKGYLVPIDAPDPATNRQNEQDFLKVALDMDQVESWAKQVDAKHVLFVFDSCFSGTIFKQRSGKEKPLYVQSVMNKPVRQFLTAGDADQRVPAKSVFTPLFIRALEGEADVINRDGYVTGNELGNYLKQNLSEYTKYQTPQFGTIRDPDLDQGDIVFRALNAPQFVATTSARPTVNPSPTQVVPTPQPTPTAPPIPKPTPSPVLKPGTTLISRSTGVNYTNLRDLLAAGKWKAADEETARAMLQAVKREKEGWFRQEDIDNFSCEDLRMIDQLWLSASKGKFGFSVQKEIYESLGGTKEYDEEVWDKFGDRVGWKKGVSWLWKKELTYSAEAPKAHLPAGIGRSGGIWGRSILLSCKSL